MCDNLGEGRVLGDKQLHRRRVCVFDAKDAEAVREAFRFSGVKFDRIWAAEQVLDDEE
jgi:hypothetical protein